MPNPLVGVAIAGINKITVSRSQKYNIQRTAFDPKQPAQLEKCGLSILGDDLKIISSGLHRIAPEKIQRFAENIIASGRDTAIYVDNTQSDYLLEHGHTYYYCSQKIPVETSAVDFIINYPNRSLRYFIQAFPNYISELPAGTVAEMRQRIKAGEKDSKIFFDLRHSEKITAYQKAQWESDASMVGDVMLGRNAIVLYTQQMRYFLQNDQYIVDIITPATREFHPLDGSVIWLRILDTINQAIIFAAVGSGKHRNTLMDAMNNMGAMTIWHYMAQVQRYLYRSIPSDHESTYTLIERAYKADPVVHQLYKTQQSADVDGASGFLRGMRGQHANETANNYGDLVKVGV